MKNLTKTPFEEKRSRQITLKLNINSIHTQQIIGIFDVVNIRKHHLQKVEMCINITSTLHTHTHSHTLNV